jgi:hypothetical protein
MGHVYHPEQSAFLRSKCFTFQILVVKGMVVHPPFLSECFLYGSLNLNLNAFQSRDENSTVPDLLRS